MKDYYQILGVSREASLEELNQAYRDGVTQYQPEQYHSGNKAVLKARLQELKEAYETLSHPNIRETYDQRLLAAAQPQPTSIRFKLKSMLLWALGTYLVLQLFRALPFKVVAILLILAAIGVLWWFRRAQASSQ